MQKDKIKEQLSQIPLLPGIYKMLDKNDNIIYIGKSKCLAKRVRSYFSSNPSWEKVKKMVNLIHHIEIIVTDTHLEARLLECELIKTHKPYFNALMKNDQRYVYVKVLEYTPNNPLTTVYEREDHSFGPFRNKFKVMDCINSLRNLYPILIQNKRYDFEYHTLLAPLNKDLFEQNQIQLLELFQNTRNIDRLILQIEEKMKKAASQYKYETASMYRDIIPKLEYLKKGVDGYSKLLSKRLLLKLPTDGGVKLFYISRGSILLKKRYKRCNEKSLQLFIEKGRNIEEGHINHPHYHPIGLLEGQACILNEKTQIDFQDILYSEILSLPDKFVQEL